MKDFLSDIRTKGELCEYLSEKVLIYSKSSESKLKNFIVTAGTSTKGNIHIEENLENHDQEEADTILLLHALSVNKTNELVIESPDTDVLTLMINFYPQLPTKTSFQTGKGDQKRKIDVQKVNQQLGEKRASALLGFHAFTGSDLCGRFAGRTKDFCFKVFLQCDDLILNALATLGTANELSSEIYQELERFVCLLYKSKSHSSVGSLRWFLYSNKEAEAESLPPTSSALRLHIMRANFITIIWKKADKKFQLLPPVCNFGWKSESDSYIAPLRCTKPPAPDAVINLVKCGCKT